MYGPGAETPGRLRNRTPLVRANSIEQVEEAGEGYLARMDGTVRERIRRAKFKACIATTDVHEYGKILVETVLRGLDVEILDGGTSTDPNDLAREAKAVKADLIALSPIFIGGKLNRVPDGSNTSLPVDASPEITAAGATVCPDVQVLLDNLARLSTDRAA
jgi:hypothetical protein